MPEGAIHLPDTEAICINVGTAAVTALALLSLRRYFAGPVRLVECSQDEAEKRLMRRLADHLGLTYEDRPLKPHGDTLDQLFQDSQSAALLLVDSDLEVLSAQPLLAFAEQARRPSVAAAGFVQDGHWAVVGGMPHAWYAARLWLPLAWFRTAPVGRLLAAGVSFRARRTPNEFPGWPFLARMLSLRSRLPGLRRLGLDFLGPWRGEIDGVRPSFVYHDTGADIHRALLAGGQEIAAIDWTLQREALTHLHGATRSRLTWLMPNATSWRTAQAEARRRLMDAYANELPPGLKL
ncbi:MAG: hypothetical protein ACXIUM_04540 [Wenzhouxiangella sp.]